LRGFFSPALPDPATIITATPATFCGTPDALPETERQIPACFGDAPLKCACKLSITLQKAILCKALSEKVTSMHASVSSRSSTQALPGSRADITTGNEYLAFKLGDEEYGIDILKVQEIRGYENVTRIANAPEFIKGVINLRGIIVPIVDMRIKFNLGEPSYDQFTVVIILSIAGRVMGMVVDSVSDVTTLQPDQIRPAPQMGCALNTDYLVGLGTLEERMLILLDIERLMSSAEMGLLQQA
jgi:purine-binding chemotaxis protein CheW